MYTLYYAKDLDMYLAFTVRDRMSDISELAMYWSYNGKDLEEAVGERENFKAYSHNLGIAKDEKGHISTKEPQTIGYAYGKEWGSWSLVLQDFTIIVE